MMDADPAYIQRFADRGIRLEGWWKFEEGSGTRAADSSGNNRALTAVGTPTWTRRETFSGAIELDGATKWLATEELTLRTDESFSVVAWVRLDSGTLNGNLQPPPGIRAWTAVSQSGLTHSPFYLGTRAFEEVQSDGATRDTFRWCFTIAPVDGSVTGLLEWQHATSAKPIDTTLLDTWVLLVGVCDVRARRNYLYVPGSADQGVAHPPDEWQFWHADGGFQVGQARYLSGVADLWPGSVGEVCAFAGALTADDAAVIYSDGLSRALTPSRR